MGRLGGGGRLPLLNKGGDGLGRRSNETDGRTAETGPSDRDAKERTRYERWSYLLLPRPEFVSASAAAAPQGRPNPKGWTGH